MTEKTTESVKKTELIYRSVSVFAFAVIITLALLFSLNKSFCWFSDNRKSSASGMNFGTSRGTSSLLAVDFFPVVSINGSAYTFIDTPNGYIPELPCEDPAQIASSVYKKAIVMRISYCVVEQQGYIRVYHNRTQSGTVNTPWIGIDSNAVGNNWISNCIQFSQAISVNGYVFTKNPATSTSFITGNPHDTVVKNDYLTFNLPQGSGELYLLMEYSPALIEYFCLCSQAGVYTINYNNDLFFELL